MMSVGFLLKKGLFAGLMLIGFSQVAKANLSIEGHYQGKNLILVSPESEDGFGYCISRVTVNGEVSTDGYQASAFQINLTEFNIKIGDPVLVFVEHEPGCKPKLINPEVLLPKSTYVLNDISCTADGILSWSTTGESGKLTYQIEQFKWNKWIVIGEVAGIGTDGNNKYTFNVSPNSGENKVRVTQTDNTGKKRVSKEVVFNCATCPVPVMQSQEDGIAFENEGNPVTTKYEIYDAYGNIVKKGMSAIVKCGNLKDGVYHVNYDNKHERYIKK